MSKRGIQVLGLAAAGGVGYYLYTAGGDLKVAQKKAEADASKLSADIKHNLPGSGKEAKKEGEAAAQSAGQKIDSYADSVRSRANDTKAKADQYEKEGIAKFDASRKEAADKLNAAVDKFDKTVEKKTSEAKSGISSWFGGGK